MMPNNISATTLWIVGGFLLITLILGLYKGRGIKDIKEYALGDGRFSTFSLVLTYLATNIGADEVLGFIPQVYSIGIIIIIAALGKVIRELLFAFILSPNIKKFNKCYTISDMVEMMYGKHIAYFTGIITLARSILITAIQFIFIGEVCEALLGIGSQYGILIGGIILGIYSAIGGIKSVTYTDVFQFIVLIIAIPTIASLLVKNVNGYKSLFSNLPKEKFTIFKHKNFYYYLASFLSWSLLPTSFVSPPIMQRILMTNGEFHKIRNMFFSNAVFFFPFFIILMLIGLASSILYPNINPKQLVYFVINDLFKNPVLKGFIVSGIISVLISTADSFLHTFGLIFSHDLLRPFYSNSNKKFNELLMVRISTFVLSFFSIFVAIYFGNNFVNLISYSKFIACPMLLFPIFAGIIGINTNKKSFYIGGITGIIVYIYVYYFFSPSLKMLAIPLSIIFNGISFMMFHLIQNKGLAWIEQAKDDNEKPKEKLWIPNPEKIITKLINLIPTPRKIYNYSKHQVMKNGSQNIIFGIYACINFTLPYFLWDHQDTEKYNLMTNLRLIGGIMAGLLIVKDQWKEFLKRYYPLYWHITLTYCLPFITTVMFLLTNGSTSWLLNVGTSIFFLIMLVTGEVFLILAPLGVTSALIFYKFYVGPINLSSLGFDINYYLIYQVVFSTIIGLLFAYRKKIFNIIQGEIGLNLGSALCHELRNTLYSLTCNQYNRIRMERIEQEGPKVIEGEESYIISKQLFMSFLDQTNQAINFDEDTLKVIKTFERIFKDYKKSITNPSVCSMKSVIEYTLKELHFLPGQKEKIKLNLIDDFYIKIPKSAFAFVISNIIRNAFKHGRATEVEIKLENHKLKIRDNGIGIPPSKLEKIFKMHYTTGQEDSSGIGLGFAKLIVESIYGEIWCESEQGEGSYSEFIIRFPKVSSSEITKESLIEINEDSKKQGQRTEKERIVIKMLKEGESIKKIEDYTELKKSEINEIKNSFEL